MNKVRRAERKDMPKIIDLLVQVDMVHHVGRPDLFKGPATKYTEEQLMGIIGNDQTPIFVCVDDKDYVLGYAFCILKQYVNDNILTDIKTLYIDDLCVDEACRGKHIGTALYAYVKDFAKSIGADSLTLNVWEGNDSAKAFYEHLGMSVQRTTMEDKF